MKRVLALLGLLVLVATAGAQDAYWITRDGQPVPDTDGRKSPISLRTCGAQAARDSVRGCPDESIVSSLIGLRQTLCR